MANVEREPDLIRRTARSMGWLGGFVGLIGFVGVGTFLTKGGSAEGLLFAGTLALSGSGYLVAAVRLSRLKPDAIVIGLCITALIALSSLSCVGLMVYSAFAYDEDSAPAACPAVVGFIVFVILADHGRKLVRCKREMDVENDQSLGFDPIMPTSVEPMEE